MGSREPRDQQEKPPPNLNNVSPLALALKPDSLVIEAGINDLVAASFLDDPSKSLIARKTTEILPQLVSSAVLGHHPYLATIIRRRVPIIGHLLLAGIRA